jgi:dsDNA-binding SOS-regulon protein
MKTNDKRLRKKTEENDSSKRQTLSLYSLSTEDALRAAAKTGRPPAPDKPKNQFSN